MTNQEILFKAVNKACDNGYRGDDINYYKFNESIWHLDNGKEYEDYAEICVRNIIFDHSFAKAFWGTWKENYEMPESYLGERWEYYLQKIILEKEPLKYLEKFL